MDRIRLLIRAFALAASLAAAGPAGAIVLANCDFKGLGDPLSRGFYIDEYGAVTLSTVTLGHTAETEGVRTIALTARLNAYNGKLIKTATVTRPIGPAMTVSTFDFGDVRVPEGATVAFTQAVVAGDPAVTYDRGEGDCPGVQVTFDSTPGLSEPLRQRVGLVVTGSPSDDRNATTLACPFDPLGGFDDIAHGFYVTDYGGTQLRTVTLRHRATTKGRRWIRLTARLGGFDGPILGDASDNRSIETTPSLTLFDFGDIPVPAGSTIAFTQELLTGETGVQHDAGFGPCANVAQSKSGTKALGTFHRGSIGVAITGRPASGAWRNVIEYFHAGFGHYFVTADPDEIAGLDAGAFNGAFVRTGQSFRSRDGPVQGALAVCRFFTVAFAPLSSHFYTADAPECAGLKSNPAWQYEKIAFYNAVPEAGACPEGTIPVFRLYNDGMSGAPNHRFTTSPAIRDDFVQNRGWTSEGIRFCAPA